MNPDLQRAVRALSRGAAADPTELAEVMKTNHRYARELLNLAVSTGHARIEQSTNGFADEWTVTDLGRQLARQSLSGVKSNSASTHTGHTPKEHTMASTKNQTKSAKTTAAKASKAPAAVRHCGCGCGSQVAGKAVFRQGHDARMVSQLAAETVTGNGTVPPVFNDGEATLVSGDDDIQYRIDETAKAVERYFGVKLAAKYHSAAMNAWAKYDRKTAAAKPAKAPKQIEAKVGRWTHTGHVTAEGDFIYTVKGAEKVAAKGKWTAV